MTDEKKPIEETTTLYQFALADTSAAPVRGKGLVALTVMPGSGVCWTADDALKVAELLIAAARASKKETEA